MTTTGGFSSKRLARVREPLERYVRSSFVPGVVAVLARHGEVQVEATANLAFEGAGSRTTIFIRQREHAGDQRLPMWHDFWTAVYQAIDD